MKEKTHVQPRYQSIYIRKNKIESGGERLFSPPNSFRIISLDSWVKGYIKERKKQEMGGGWKNGSVWLENFPRTKNRVDAIL